MHTYERFQKGIEYLTGEAIKRADVDYETLELFKEEIDARYFTTEEWDALPDICKLTAVTYVSKSKDKYLMSNVYDEVQKNLLKTLWYKNNEELKFKQ